MVHLNVLVHMLDLMGHDTGWVAPELGLPPVTTWQDQAWVDIELLDRLMCLIVERTGKPDMGLVAATSQAMLKYGVPPMLLMHAPSFKQAMQDIIRYSDLMFEMPELSLETGIDHNCLVLQPTAISVLGRRFRCELTMAGLLQVLRFMGARDADILQADFQHAQPDYLARYRETFGSIPLVFNASANRIVLSRRVWTLAPSFRDDTLYQRLKADAEVLLAKLPYKDDLETKVRQLIRARLADAPMATEIAQAMDLSARGLRRALTDAGLCFSDLLSQERIKQAKMLLLSGDMPPKAVALKLGFQSVSSFHRAFRNWTGETPMTWRARQIQQASDTVD